MAGYGITDYQIGRYKIDVSRRLLLDEDEKVVALTPKVFDLLLFLVSNNERVVTKDEIMSAIWPDTVVEESNLTQNVSILRRALGETRGENVFIATIPGQGYRFVAEVTRPGDTIEETTRETVPAPLLASKPKLKAILVGASILGILIIGLVFYFSRSRPAGVVHEKPKVLAILPFKPLVNEGRDEALEIGMTDTLIARLSNVPGILLRPLSSVRKFVSGEQDPQSAGQELDADVVLDGTIQRWGEQIRVNVRLIDVSSGAALWGGTFDEDYRNIFIVQDNISTKVADALSTKLTNPGTAESKKGTSDAEAYRFYLQARLYQFKSTPHELRQSIAFYRRAIEIDPGYAQAYAGMADAYRTLPITSDVAAREAFPESKAAAQKALGLDPELADAYVALGYVSGWFEWDWKTAESEMRKALALEPNTPDAHRGLSILMTVQDRHGEAVEEMRRARELDPLSLPANALEAQALHYAGRDQEAIERLNKTFEIDPNFWIARIILARIYIGQNQLENALTELEKARAASSGNTETISLKGYVLARLGRREEATAALYELRATSTTYSPSYNIAMVLNGLGETDAALRSLEDAAKQRDVRLILLKVERKWDNLRQEPRFIALLRRLNLE